MVTDILTQLGDLSSMASVTQVAEGIYRIDIGLVKTRSGDYLGYSLVYFIVAGGETAIIDTSPAAVTPDILAAIRGIGYDPARLSHIILTHIHLDHAGGVGALAQQFPGVKVAVHKRGAGHIVKPAMLIEGTKQAYGENFEADYGPISPVPKEQVIPVDEGDIIRVGTRELKIMYTPGHAPHHICVYDSQSRGIFSGDALGYLRPGNNSVIIVAGFDLDSALDSIDRLQALNPKSIYAAHGTADREPGEFIQSVRNTTKDYGEIILEAMRAGEGEEEMERRLGVYQKAHSPDDPRDELCRVDEIIPWYIACFKRKGLA